MSNLSLLFVAVLGVLTLLCVVFGIDGNASQCLTKYANLDHIMFGTVRTLLPKMNTLAGKAIGGYGGAANKQHGIDFMNSTNMKFHVWALE